MLFNSLSFAIFLPLVFLTYWLIGGKRLTLQNALLLVASYFFYSCWDWRFLFLLCFSTLLDYFSGIKIAEAKVLSKKRFWFWLSIIVNLGFLGVFKYYNFFAESFSQSFEAIGVHVNPWTLSVILPVGISFYTFHGLSYVIDIYKDRIKAEYNFIDYAVFVSFFPLLVAGPIERATHLLPQIKKERSFSYKTAVSGLRLILWGLFKKVVIADQCGAIVNQIFENQASSSSATLFIGALFFTFQIYGDFSGYSDMAIGIARLFGIELLRNFSYPYFSRDIAEFWRRWHISLSSWFRDYLYIPLGGSKGGRWKQVKNTIIIFVVSGFWHGANWTFIFWGFLNAVYFIPLLIAGKNRNNIEIVGMGEKLKITSFLSVLGTFFLVVVGWIFFRSPDIVSAFSYLVNLFMHPGSYLLLSSYEEYLSVFALIILFMSIEWVGRTAQNPLDFILKEMKPTVRYVMYYGIVSLIIWFGGKEEQFIYFQF